MSEWNVPKIREECLRLMGWKHDPTLGLWGGPFVNWRDPSGTHVLESGIPDPTSSLDEALPLFKANDGTFIWLGLTEDGEEFEAQHGAFRQVGNNPALAVCLLRLELAGHDLDDFRVKA